MADLKKFLDKQGVSTLWSRVAEEVAKVDAKAVKNAEDIAAHAGDIATMKGQIAALEAASATHALKTEVEAVETALGNYQTSNNAAVALKASNADLEAEIARAKAAEKANADAITLLTDGVDQEKVDSVKDLIAYVEEHGPEVEQMQKDIAANTKAVSDEATRADTEEKRLAGLIADNADEKNIFSHTSDISVFI